MLIGTTLTVKEISSRVGFNDQFYFSNIFKRKTGLAPENYRKESFI
jgi:two-component system response regulator YesN